MKWLSVLYLIVFVFVFIGCQGNGNGAKKNKSSIAGVDHHSESQLRQSLGKFEEFFANSITDASDELDRLSGDARPRRSTLKLRSITIKASGAMLRQEEVITAFIDVWVLSARLRMYFENGYGSKTFEPNQNVVIGAMKKIESRIENVGREYLDEEHFAITRKKVNDFANANPIKPDMKEVVLFATEAYQGQASPFEEIINLPLLPFSMVNGMTEGVTGTGKMAGSIDGFADVLEAFPESARWQLLMLLYDIEKLDSVKSAVGSFSEFSEGTSRLADSADKLPEKIRIQINDLLKQIEERSPDFRKTLESVSRTSGSINETLKAGDKFTGSIKDSCDKVRMAAAAWQSAAEATDTAVSRMIELREPDESAGNEKFDINAYRETAIEFNALADKLPSMFDQADEFSKKLTRRIAMLIVIFFAMAIALTLCIVRRPKNKSL